MGNEAREGGFDIGGDVGVGVFVDDDAGGGVRDVEVADAGVDGGILHEFGDGGGDVEQLGAALGADGDFAGAGVGGFGTSSWLIMPDHSGAIKRQGSHCGKARVSDLDYFTGFMQYPHKSFTYYSHIVYLTATITLLGFGISGYS